MTSDAAIVALIDALEVCRIDYMLVGSLASNFHGVPRATQDADLVVTAARSQIEALATTLGPSFLVERQRSFETVTGTTRHLIRLTDQPFSFELFDLSDDAHDRERFKRRLRVQALGRATAIATAEDMIVTKLRWAVGGRRLKDVDDVRNILLVKGDTLDWPYIERWCEAHGTNALLDEIRASIGPA